MDRDQGMDQKLSFDARDLSWGAVTARTVTGYRPGEDGDGHGAVD